MNETITLTRNEAEAIAMLIYNLLPDPGMASLATAVIFAGREEMADAFFSGINKLVEPLKRERAAEQPSGVLPFRPRGSQVN